ncbi:hypothetical protein SGGMMB4_05723 (plasmid) [Sodalis glossinidius str. 'morsitans']|uniref:YajA protein n=1 Tax=Sodalis glossinidius (strain morsitans) TaxID=343509 RepID=A0A193QNX6_SODGM|nr:hypothetical protein [Sodalis glossinidius]CAI59336.1 YajA protein [Sodalis glossinidius]CAI59509.1 YajA protein [Sodalis glossinidius]CRL46808.1 hypothetical protein SGGMMB4_05723 [Sodalis glossinidius str. 'morsitans']
MNSGANEVKPSPEDVKQMRIAAGLTLKECTNIFGISLRIWQKKEESNNVSSRSITKGEYLYLLLLAGKHPEFTLNKRTDIEE